MTTYQKPTYNHFPVAQPSTPSKGSSEDYYYAWVTVMRQHATNATKKPLNKILQKPFRRGRIWV